VLVEEGMDIRQELYLGIVIDRKVGLPVIMASSAGGMEIEEVARTRPDAIVKVHVDPATGVQGFHTRKLSFGLGLKGGLLKEAAAFVTKLYQAFEAKDCSLAEINPLVITGEGRLLALDAKMNFDDNALSRHPELQALRDLDEESPLEVEASKFNLNYIKLDGNVGCMVNGAGLAMSTMDIIKLAGGEPANFLDVGGGASAEQIENAFRILISDGNVRSVFINIFGGILRCDRLAEGVIKAVTALDVKLPIVIRMEGTNVALGQRMLRESGLNFITAQGMKDGAEKAVQAARGT
jgi:succinyl-CoA synthetase beta subunit